MADRTKKFGEGVAQMGRSSVPFKDLQPANLFLEQLLSYLDVDPNISLQLARDQDDQNISDPRAFAYTMQKSPEIFITRQLLYAPINIQCGILLHEIGHIVLNQFSGPQSEVEVDAWCLRQDPEYTFVDFSYRNSITDLPVVAKAVQRCGEKFVNKVKSHG